MDLKQLAALTAVADHHSFSAAADALHTVQSNVSTHVARLEREVGQVLIDRSTITLTPAGQLVVDRARRIQAELDALGGDLASSSRQIVGTVRLGLIGTTGRWLAPMLLPEAERQHPGLRLVLIDATTTSLLPQLQTRQLDLAVVNLPVTDPDVDSIALFDEHHVIVAPEGHPLWGRRTVDVTELAAHRVLMPPPGTAYRDELDAEAHRKGVTMQPAAEIDGMRLLATLAFEGFGAALLPATAASRRGSANWSLVDVEGLVPRTVGLAWARRALLSAAARAVRDLIIDLVHSESARHEGIRPHGS